jgi:hypothetical protein
VVRTYCITVVLVVVAAAIAFFTWPRSTPVAAEAGAVVVRPAEPAATSVPSPVPEAAAPSAPPRSAVEMAILASMEDPHAELRGVVIRGDAPQIACGEKRTSKDPVFRRFVWLGHLKMLATDDGSKDFGNIAAVCREGQPIP